MRGSTILSLFVIFHLFYTGNYLTLGNANTVDQYGMWSFDSYTYYEAGEYLANGSLHYSRTPVYPLIIICLRAVFGSVLWAPVLMLLQYLIFLISGLALARIALKYISNYKISFWITTIYLITPGFVGYTLYILTESLSISGIIFFIWFLAKDMPKPPSSRNMLIACILLFILVFLRPIFIYLIPVVVIYAFLIAWQYGLRGFKPVLTAVIMMFVVVTCLFGYKKAIAREYGLNSMTLISVVNNWCTARQAIGAHPELAEDSELRELLIEIETQNNENIFDTVSSATSSG